jgi:queuosine biosynthesis protein QueC
MTISPNPRKPAVTGRQSYEPSARSRGLLFTTTAIFAAAAHGVAEVSVPENGQLALNPPLTASRAGACSTRSVHPQTLHLLNALIESIGGNIRVTNPFEHRTKGEVCAAALEAGLKEAVLWKTVSCGHPPNQRGNGTQANCGYCFPCLIRRSGLRQATGHDQTPYNSGPDAWLSDKHGDDFRAVWQWLQRPFTRRDLVADCALPNMSAGHLIGWVNTIRRGRHELATMLQELLPDPQYAKNARLQI